jgi:hypothetical protein
LWRVSAAWVEQATGTRWADLIHVSSGKVRTVRLSDAESNEDARTRSLD